MSEPMVLKISPSGAIAGDPNNPPLMGGTADPPDGSMSTGRVWIYHGAGVDTNVPGSAVGGDVAGLGSVLTDLRAGYSYDLEFDMYFFGTLTAAQDYTITIKGSKDGGATFPDTLTSLTSGPGLSPGATSQLGRLHEFAAFVQPATAPYDHLKVFIQRLDADAGVDLAYTPVFATLKVTEYS